MKHLRPTSAATLAAAIRLKTLYFILILCSLTLATAAEAQWTEEQKLLASDGEAFDEFGESVAISGNYAIVGTTEADNMAGAAYIYELTSSGWVETAVLTAPDGATGDTFGNSVAISGDVAVVGADADDDNGFNSGSVYVFRFSGSAWPLEQKLTDGASEDGFGNSVAIHDDLVIVGSQGDDDDAFNSGSAHIYRFDESVSLWSLEQELTASDPEAFDNFGRVVAIADTVVMVGSRDWDHSINTIGPGAAYIFRLNGGVWQEEQKLIASDGQNGDRFGSSLAFSDSLAIVGAYTDDDSSSGSAYIFRFDGGFWHEEQKLTASDAGANDRFGFSVAISDTGAFIGAPKNDNGSVYRFQFDGVTWQEEQKLTASDGQGAASFGFSVAISEEVVLVGARNDSENGDFSGAAYIFRNTPCDAPTLSFSLTDLTCPDANDGRIIVSTSGGAGTFTYSLDGGTAQASNVFSDLAAGDYDITVIVDGNQACSTEASVTLAVDEELEPYYVFVFNLPGPTMNAPLSFNAAFEGLVDGLEPSDMDVLGGTVTDIVDYQDGTFDIEVTPDSPQETVTLQVLAGAAFSLDCGAPSIQSNVGTIIYDAVAPIISPVSIASNYVDPSKATTGDEITLSFNTDEALQGTPVVSVNTNPASVSGSGTAWTATYTVMSSDHTGAVTFAITAQDPAGNSGAASSTTDGSAVSIYDCPLAVNGLDNFNTDECGCYPGYYQSTMVVGNDTIITACTICPPGSYCPDGVDAFLCEVGSFQDQEGQTSCIDCEAGEFSDIQGAEECIACDQGETSNPGASVCGECPLAFNPSVQEISETSVLIFWETSNNLATSFNVEVGLAGFTPTGMATYVETAAGGTAWSDAQPATDYDFYVQTVCGAGVNSAWAGPFSFSTSDPCDSDLEAPVITCPSDLVLELGSDLSPAGAAGMATVTDNCDAAPSLFYTDVSTQGRIVRVTLTAPVSHVQNLPIHGINAAVGDVMTGYFTYDLDAVDQDPLNPGRGIYTGGTGLMELNGNIISNPSNPVQVTFDINGSNDLWGWSNQSAFDVNGVEVNDGQFVFNFTQPDGLLTSDDQISMADFSLLEVSQFNISGPGNGLILFYDATIQSIELISNTTENCPQDYTVERTWYAQDASGNGSTCVQNIEILDTTAPVITCPLDMDTLLMAGEMEAIVEYDLPSVVDGSVPPVPTSLPGYTYAGTFGGSTYYRSNTVARAGDIWFESFATGGHLVSISSQAENDFVAAISGQEDFIGFNEDDDQTEYSWFDQEPVTYTNWAAGQPLCEGNHCIFGRYTMTNFNGQAGEWGAVHGLIERHYIIEFDDESLIPVLTAGLPSGSAFPIGTTTVTYTATDACGLSSSCSFDVTVTGDDVAVTPITPSVFGEPNWVVVQTEFDPERATCSNDVYEFAWISFVANSPNDVIIAQSVTEVDFVAIELYDAIGGTLLECFDNYDDGFNEIERALPGNLMPGETYFVKVWTSNREEGFANVPIRVQVKTYEDGGLQAQYCDESDYLLSNSIYAERDDLGQLYSNPAVNVKGYAFRFQEQGGGLDVTVTHPDLAPYISLSNVAGLEYGKSYDVSVKHLVRMSANGSISDYWSQWGTSCAISLGEPPVTQLSEAYCNALDLDLSDQLLAEPLAGASQYRFTFTGGGQTFTKVSSNYAVLLYTVGSSNGGLEYATTYDVSVQAMLSGIWTSVGDICTVGMAAAPPGAVVQQAYCDGTYLASNPNYLLATQVYGAEEYTWRFTQVGGVAIQEQVTAGLSLAFHLADDLDLQSGQYAVDVKVKAGGLYGDYAGACTITIDGGEAGVGGVLDQENETAFKANNVVDGYEMSVYPNPNAGEEFFVRLEGLNGDAQMIDLSIVDVLGQVVLAERYAVKGIEPVISISSMDLSSGVYLINAQAQGSQPMETRLIVK